MEAMEENPPAQEPEVFFCDLCQESIPERDLLEGRAVEVQGRRVCRRCRARLVPPLPSARLAAVLAFLALLAAGAAAGLLLLQKREADQWRRARASWEDGWTVRWEAGREEARREREALRKALQSLGKRVGGAEKTLGELARARKTLSDALEALKKDMFALRTSLTGKMLVLAERLSALETALGGTRKGVEELSRRFASLSKQIVVPRSLPLPGLPRESGSPSPQVSPKAPSEKELARLEKQLQSPEADQRWKAVEALEKMAGPEAVRLVARALQDKDIWVRRLAAEVLGRMGREEAIGPLIEALSDPEAMIRAAALASLKTLTGKTFGYDPNTSPGARKRALLLWRAWWEKRKGGGKSPKG